MISSTTHSEDQNLRKVFKLKSLLGDSLPLRHLSKLQPCIPSIVHYCTPHSCMRAEHAVCPSRACDLPSKTKCLFSSCRQGHPRLDLRPSHRFRTTASRFELFSQRDSRQMIDLWSDTRVASSCLKLLAMCGSSSPSQRLSADKCFHPQHAVAFDIKLLTRRP